MISMYVYTSYRGPWRERRLMKASLAARVNRILMKRQYVNRWVLQSVAETWQ